MFELSTLPMLTKGRSRSINQENYTGEKGKGYAIFLHCFGYYKYTLGCVAVSKTNMIKILQTCGDGTMICIYRK